MRWMFHATAGFLGRVDSQTQCGFWAEEPADHGFDPGRLITVDLARTPTAAVAKQIGFREVEVDDCFTGPNGVVSGTTLGPAWPELRMAGVVFSEPDLVAMGRAALDDDEFQLEKPPTRNPAVQDLRRRRRRTAATCRHLRIRRCVRRGIAIKVP